MVATFSAVVGVLHANQVEILLPIGPLFLQGRGAIADLDPASGLVRAKTGVVHIAQVFALGDGAPAKRLVLNRF